MPMKTKKQYLIVDSKRYRRHSAPENLGVWFAPQGRQSFPGAEDWCRASVSDFSILLEKQSESYSSLELDTSNLSRDLSPVPTTKTSPRDSYQSFPLVDFQTRGKSDGDNHWQGFGSRSTWKTIFLSQAIAGCVAMMDASNASLKCESQNLLANGQNLLHYVLLGVLWTSKLALRNNGRDIIEVIKYSGFRYFFLAVLHVEASWLLLSSFRHATYLGNQMRDCVAACLCMVVAYVCLEVQFRFTHTSGFVFTMAGALGLFVANTMHDTHNYEGALLGDVLRIAGGIFLALNSIAQEIIVKSIDFVEYMGMIGLIGSLICGLQAIILETNIVVLQTSTYWLNVATYAMAQFLFNSLTPKLLHGTGATGLHLALTASEFYFYFIQVISQSQRLHVLYVLSYGITLTGSILFFFKRTVMGTEAFFPIKITIIKEN